MKTINFTKNEVEILNAAGQKTGLKEVDNWLANSQTDHKNDKIIQVKVEPFELTLNGEKRKVEIIDFFLNASAEIILTKQLENNQLLALRWEEAEVDKGIGFATNRPNVLVVYTNLLELNNHEKYGKTRKTEDIEINWKNVISVEDGTSGEEAKHDSFVFDIVPQTYSVNGNNLTFNKLFWFPRMWGIDTVSQAKIEEWKAAQKPLILEKVNLGDNDWFSVEAGNYLVVSDYKDSKLEEDIRRKRLSDTKEKIKILSSISGWEKLPNDQKNKFRQEYENRGFNDLKPEIEKAIKALKNGSNEPESNQKKPNSSASEFPWKITILVFSIFLVLVVIILWLKNRKARKN